MRISVIETFPVALPFRERYLTAAGGLDSREMVILRVTSSDGAVGHGDAIPMSLRGGPGLERIRADLDGPCRGVLEAATLDASHPPAEAGASIRPLLDACVAAGAGPGAVGAVDIALIDLVAKAYGVPAWVVLGAPAARAVRCNGTLGGGAPETTAVAAGRLVERGFDSIKVKAGTGDDLARMRAVRDACGRGAALRIDANGAWDLEQAAEMLESLSEVGLELAEQPCPSLQEMAALRERVAVPLVADESVATVDQAETAMALDACDAVTLKLAKVGGPHAALRVGSHAPSYLSSALDSPLGIVAAAHTVQALPALGFAAHLAHGLATSGMFADSIADASELGGPLIELHAVPGLGVEVDDEALERLRIR